MSTLNLHIARDGFRLRGAAMSRIDGFSDVVFGFAITLLVVSLEVPRTYPELHALLRGFIPFAICFFFLIMVWWSHFRFFRRYGLHDAGTITVNAILLFTILFYVYPLKFLFTLLTQQMFGHVGPSVFTSVYQGRELMVGYGTGFAATYFCLSALYWNAWRQRQVLSLNRLERFLTLSYAWDEFGVGFVGILCCIAALLLPPERAGSAGWFFFLIGVWKTIHGFVAGPRIRAADAQTPAEDRLPLPQ
ncbi:MAG TPA: TMEM175 family protein [Acidobacteriaceae bacterium]|jgi:hypothetical protein|nr:TMEM175 family protein [Acidobacteriaceae bacterium]